MSASVSGYRAQVATSYGAAIEVHGAGTDIWHSVYNNTGGALTNSQVKLLTFIVTSSVLFPTLIAVATNTTVRNIVAVVDNSPYGQGTIADGAWGFAKIRGYVSADVDGTADLSEGDQLQVINGGTAFIDQGSAEGAVLHSDTSAIVLEAYTTDAVADKSVYLLGGQCSVAAS